MKGKVKVLTILSITTVCLIYIGLTHLMNQNTASKERYKSSHKVSHIITNPHEMFKTELGETADSYTHANEEVTDIVSKKERVPVSYEYEDVVLLFADKTLNDVYGECIPITPYIQSVESYDNNDKVTVGVVNTDLILACEVDQQGNISNTYNYGNWYSSNYPVIYFYDEMPDDTLPIYSALLSEHGWVGHLVCADIIESDRSVTYRLSNLLTADSYDVTIIKVN